MTKLEKLLSEYCETLEKQIEISDKLIALLDGKIETLEKTITVYEKKEGI